MHVIFEKTQILRPQRRKNSFGNNFERTFLEVGLIGTHVFSVTRGFMRIKWDNHK
jgi:hypothetical protein